MFFYFTLKRWLAWLAPCDSHMLLTLGHKHGVSIQSSINFGDTLLQITCEWETAKIWFFGDVVNLSIIYQIPDSWLYSLNGYDFQFWSHDRWKSRLSSHHPLYNFWGQYDGWRVNQTKTKDPKHNWYFDRNVFSPALDPQQDCKQEWSTADVGVREKPEYFL